MQKNPELLFALGRPFAPLYAAVMTLRAWLYRHGRLASTKLPVPVVSIGNLTMGGTGKTPMVIYLARLLSSKITTVIVSRGYGGKAKGPINLVADATGVYLSSQLAGDEPRLLADSLPGVAVVTGRKRAVTGRYAVESLNAELLLLDDGFQHLALQRDLDLVLFAASTLMGNGRVCPGGPLREPFSALSRAHAFVITGVGEDNHRQVAGFVKQLQRHFPAIPVFQGAYRVCGWQRGDQNEDAVTAELDHIPLFAFCGIANPRSFKTSLTEQRLQVQGFRAFADHHDFRASDLLSLEQAARQAGCQGLVTTAKDFVKLKRFPLAMPLWVMQVELVMEPSFDQFVLGKIV